MSSSVFALDCLSIVEYLSSRFWTFSSNLSCCFNKSSWEALLSLNSALASVNICDWIAHFSASSVSFESSSVSSMSLGDLLAKAWYKIFASSSATEFSVFIYWLRTRFTLRDVSTSLATIHLVIFSDNRSFFITDVIPPRIQRFKTRLSGRIRQSFLDVSKLALVSRIKSWFDVMK